MKNAIVSQDYNEFSQKYNNNSRPPKQHCNTCDIFNDVHKFSHIFILIFRSFLFLFFFYFNFVRINASFNRIKKQKI